MLRPSLHTHACVTSPPVHLTSTVFMALRLSRLEKRTRRFSNWDSPEVAGGRCVTTVALRSFQCRSSQSQKPFVKATLKTFDYFAVSICQLMIPHSKCSSTQFPVSNVSRHLLRLELRVRLCEPMTCEPEAHPDLIDLQVGEAGTFKATTQDRSKNMLWRKLEFQVF